MEWAVCHTPHVEPRRIHPRSPGAARWCTPVGSFTGVTAMSSSEPSASAVVLSRRDFDATLFDLDGVVTRTAQVHAEAWKRLFAAYLEADARRGGEGLRPFTPADYQRYVGGRPRLDGIRCFLERPGL